MSKRNATSAADTSCEWYDVSGLADLLGLSEGFIRSLVYRREIPYAKIGKFVRFDRNEIDQWLAERRVDALS